MTATDVQACLDLLHNAAFKELYRRTDDEFLSWTRFRLLDMPEGYAAEDIWKVLTALRRLKSYTFPYKPYTHEKAPEETWCSLNNRIDVLLREAITMANASTDRKSAQGRYRYLHILSTDLSAAIKRDGVDLSPESVHALATLQQTPRTPEELFAAEAFRMIMDVKQYSKYPLSPWMIEEVAARADQDGTLASKGLGEPKSPAYRYNTEPASKIAETLFATVNRKDLDQERYLLDLLATSMAIWDLSPFPRWNGLTEIFVRNWAFERCGLASLRVVPLSHLCLAWERKEKDIVDIEDGYFDVNPNIGEAHDATSNFGNTLRIIVEALRAEERNASGTDEETTLNNIADDHSNLNHRQRDTLLSLASDPNRKTTIALHMSLYHVSYGTARTDLLALANRDLLKQEYRSRAMVFRVHPSVIERMHNRQGKQATSKTNGIHLT